MQLWYCLRIAGKLLGEIGVDIYRQVVVRGAVYGCSRHHQFPQTILLSDCEGIIIVEDVLGGRDDLGGCLLLLFALSLLAEEIRFGTLFFTGSLRQRIFPKYTSLVRMFTMEVWLHSPFLAGMCISLRA